MVFTASCGGLQVKMMLFEIIYHVSLQAGTRITQTKKILDQPTGALDAQGVEIHPLLKRKYAQNQNLLTKHVTDCQLLSNNYVIVMTILSKKT